MQGAGEGALLPVIWSVPSEGASERVSERAPYLHDVRLSPVRGAKTCIALAWGAACRSWRDHTGRGHLQSPLGYTECDWERLLGSVDLCESLRTWVQPGSGPGSFADLGSVPEPGRCFLLRRLFLEALRLCPLDSRPLPSASCGSGSMRHPAGLAPSHPPNSRLTL